MFKAYITEQSEGQPHTTLQELDQPRLPAGDVLVAIAYSSLNYKDGLALTGKGKIARSFPMIAGIDLAGTVVESSNAVYNVGDQVVLTGWGIGERHWGGFAQYARVKAEWLIPLPPGLSLLYAMALGTAGFTAMLAVLALEAHGLKPDGREVLVTGASGGVGSVAVA
ncbi:MAG: alcohol dehydrogenase catalytic domain-containing protein, partial [Herpetosiphonaceae bacterium]|nr:alcohol dehydrogenase catalytic domain-containing protein [Herpetosiphonaceae bacterium]